MRSVSALSCHFSIVGAACEVIFVCEFCLWILLMSTVEFDKKTQLVHTLLSKPGPGG